jgi:hypothetical protein
MAAAYDVLAERADHSALTKVLDRITALRRRHAEFFAAEAHRRLGESEKAVRLTRSMLRHAVWPIGALHRGAADRERFARAVFAGADGRDRAAAIGTRVAGLTRMTAVTGARVARTLR